MAQESIADMSTVAREDAKDPAKEDGRFARLPRIIRHRTLITGFSILALTTLMAVLAPWIAPYGPLEIDPVNTLQPPSLQHWFGTDGLGRDVFSRTVFGARVSLLVGVSSVLGGAFAGTILGLVSGYRGGWVDTSIMWVMDTFLVFPALVLALAITAFLGNSLWNVIFALAVTFLPSMTRLVRGQVLSIKEKEFVMAAKGLGAGNARIMWRHILPNVIGLIIVLSAASVGAAIITEASLSFLGMGIPPPAPTWGRDLREGYSYLLINPWLSIIPGVSIFVVVLGFNQIADGIRDYFDRSRWRS